MEKVQSPLKSGLACVSDLISCFTHSPTLQSHLQLYFCSSVTPKSFLPQDFCSDCLRSSWPSSPKSDCSLNVTSSERPFLPLQSEVEPPKSLPLAPFNLYFIYQQNYFIDLIISSLSWMSTTNMGPCLICSIPSKCSTFVGKKRTWTSINLCPDAGKRETTARVHVPISTPYFHVTYCSFWCHLYAMKAATAY